MHAATAPATHNTPPRASFPAVSRIHERTDLRTREMAEAMIRLNAEHPDGCTETTLRLEGFSDYEQRQLGEAAHAIANGSFVRRVDLDGPARPTDEELIKQAIRLYDTGLDALLAKLRARPHFGEATLVRLYPRIRAGAAARVRQAPLPPRREA